MDSSKHLGRNILGGVVGNILEWYDFALFGYFAPVLGALFFPSQDHLASTVKAFGIFAGGYLMRPLGAVLFGHIGDRLGRKRALQISVIMMAIPTTLMSVLPTHAQIGMLAPVLLVVLRLIQGVSVGGELVGSVAYLTEIAPPARRGFLGSLSCCSVDGGIMLGSAMAAGAYGVLGHDAVQSWGWRLPFLLGIVVGLCGLWFRKGLAESDYFERVKEAGKIEEHPVVSVIRSMPLRIVQLVALLSIFGGGFYAFFVWWPLYLTKFVSPAVPHALLVNTIAMLVLVVLYPVAGWLSDRVGRKRTMIFFLTVLLLATYPLVLWTDYGLFWGALFCQIIFAALMAGLSAPMPALMAEMFPTHKRYSGIGMAYNMSLGVIGGTAPLICTWLASIKGHVALPALYLMVLTAVSLAALLTIRIKQGGDLT